MSGYTQKKIIFTLLHNICWSITYYRDKLFPNLGIWEQFISVISLTDNQWGVILSLNSFLLLSSPPSSSTDMFLAGVCVCVPCPMNGHRHATEPRGGMRQAAQGDRAHVSKIKLGCRSHLQLPHQSQPQAGSSSQCSSVQTWHLCPNIWIIALVWKKPSLLVTSKTGISYML